MMAGVWAVLRIRRSESSASPPAMLGTAATEAGGGGAREAAHWWRHSASGPKAAQGPDGAAGGFCGAPRRRSPRPGVRSMTILLTGRTLTRTEVVRVARGREPVALDAAAVERMAAAREVVQQAIAH